MADTLDSEIGRALAELLTSLRKKRGWSLEDLADYSGLHRTSLGLVERGVRGLSIASAEALAGALDMPLSGLIALAERVAEGILASDAAPRPRRVAHESIRDDRDLVALCGLTGDNIRHAIEYVYDTLDLIDTELILRGSQPIAGLVELANLSSMIGNLAGAGVEEASEGKYVRNRPHAFPDLVPQMGGPDLEVKTALETNSPKGHLPKPGVYLTFRYVLAAANADFVRGAKNRGRTAWIWEVRAGHLDIDDFSISNTAGDSGKTAVIKTASLKAMHLVLRDDRLSPYARPWG